MDGSATSDLDPDSRTDGTDAAGLNDDPVRLPLRQPTGAFPLISDYWPDSPQRTGNTGEQPLVTAAPPYPKEAQPPADPAATWLLSAPPPPRRPWLRLLMTIAAVLVFLGASAVALSRLIADRQASPAVPAQPATQPGGVVTDGEENLPVSVEPAPSSTAPASSAPAAGGTPTALPFTSAIFEMAGAVVDLKLSVDDLGTVPFEFSTPDGSGLVPKASIDGDTVKLNAASDGTKGSGKIEVKLNKKVEWGLRMLSGIKNGSYDLEDVDLRGIDLRGGASKIEMRLPKQDDTIPIRMSGGVNTWVIGTAEEAPVKVTLREGGGKVDLNGQRVDGVKRGTTLRDPVDDADSGGLEIDAVAGLGSLTVAAEDDL